MRYEEKAARGEMGVAKTVKANDLWRKLLGMLFETGRPWVTFKDPCNIRYTKQHVGVVHSSNLCTEIMLHTNDNVIEYNYYSVPQARNSNLRHRPVGLGIMGFQDALYKVRTP